MRHSSPILTEISLAYRVYYARTLRSTELSTAVSVRRTCSLHGSLCVCFKFKFLKECNINVSLYIFKYIYTYVYKTRMFVYRFGNLYTKCMLAPVCFKTPRTVSSASTFSYILPFRCVFFFLSFFFFLFFFFFSILSRDQFRLHIAIRDGGVITSEKTDGIIADMCNM